MIRSLLIAPQWIGDAVMSEPLVARLAARGERVSVAALPWVAPVYRAMDGVAEVIDLPFAHGRLDWGARRRLGRQWRGRHDVAYVLPNSLKAALLPWFAGIPRRIGYHGEGRYGLLTRRLPNAEGRPPMVAFYAALAEADRPLHPQGAAGGASAAPAGPGTSADGHSTTGERPRLHFPARKLDAVAAAQQLARGGWFAFAPGAEYGPAKRWPTAHYASLARELHAAHGLPVLLLGSPKERALCEEIAAACPPGVCRVVCGDVPLIDAMALIAGARGVASNDSGLMHVAAAFGVPQVALFGSTSPEHTPPLSPAARVIWLKEELRLDCAPCFDRECRFGHTRCLVELRPERALSALQDALRAALPHDASLTRA